MHDWRVAALRRIGARELLDRIRQWSLGHAERLPLARTILVSRAARVPAGAMGAIVARVREGSLVPALSLSPAGFLDNAASGEGARLICEAEKLIEDRFSLLGLQDLSFGVPPDWHLQPSTGSRSPLLHWKAVDVLDASATGDRKIIWELNRHQHFQVWARAFAVTGDERFASAFSSQLGDWLATNPPKEGLNWASSLELGFRSISWLTALQLFGRSRSLSSQLLESAVSSLALHGRHIERYLSTYYSPNTHLTGEALGLYYLGTCLPELKRAARWRRLGKTILLEQLDKQVHPDGVYFEQATWYHRYTVDFYTHFVLLAEGTGDPLPASTRPRLDALLEHLMWITRPDGTCPYIGDDDGGTLVKLEERPPNDWRAALSNGAVMFARRDYRHVAGTLSPETLWLFGDRAQAFETLRPEPPSTMSRAFHDGGYYVMRDGWTPGSNYMIVDCGPHGVMNCGHAHADALAVEVSARGETILVDPGTFTYTGSAQWRDLFRQSTMHNTVVVDGESSSVPAGPFRWKHTARCATTCWHDHPQFTYFQGSHDGYRRLPDPATHIRAVLFIRGAYWVVLDRVEAGAEHLHAVHFHMAPGIRAAIDPAAHTLTAEAGRASLDVVFPAGQGAWTVGESWVSPCYAHKVPAPAAAYERRTTGPLALMSLLVPRARPEPPPASAPLPTERGLACELDTGESRDAIGWSVNQLATAGVEATDFEWVWVRTPADGPVSWRLVLIHGTRLVMSDIAVTTGAPVKFMVLARTEGQVSIDVFPSTDLVVHATAPLDRLLVNGATHQPSPARPMKIPGRDVSPLAVPRDQADRCSHVRH